MQAAAQMTYTVISGHLHMIEESSKQGKRSDQYRTASVKLAKAEQELFAWAQTVIGSELSAIETLDDAAKEQMIKKIMQINLAHR